MSSRPWWHPDRHTDRRHFLTGRHKIKRALQTHFDANGYTEVECNALQTSPGNEAHLQAFKTKFDSLTQASQTLYLHTSPEFSCKKLLAAGENKIYDFARVYRNGEISPTHAPEFTMLEWYQTGISLNDIMNETAELCRITGEAINTKQFSWRHKTCDLNKHAEFLTLTEAFDRYAGIDLNAHLDTRGTFRDAASKAGVNTSEDASWSDIFSAVLVSKIEPNLGDGRLTFLYNYPIAEAALAKARPDDPRFAERFELYACGVELANGFNELTNPTEQRARFEAEMDLKETLYGERYPIDESFLDALEIMPDACGVAMGFDRLVMLASGARSIADVQWTPWTS